MNITKLTTQLLWQVAQTLKPNVHTDLQTNSVQGLYAMDPDEALQNPQHEMSCNLCGRNFYAKRRMENRYPNDTTANRLLKPEALFRIDAMITSKGYTKNNTGYKWKT